MMRAPDFRYYAARSAKDAARALRDGGAEAMLIAGGTDLVPNLKRRQQAPSLLIGIRHLRELRRIRNGTGLALGSAARLSEIAADRRVVGGYAALARAAGLVATPQIRNLGTVGGRVAAGDQLLHEGTRLERRPRVHEQDRRRDLLGGDVEPPLLGGVLHGHRARPDRTRRPGHARLGGRRAGDSARGPVCG
jgi:hypothetical protein